MRAVWGLALTAILISPGVGCAAEAVSPELLLSRLRATYSQGTTFSPAALRHPLREGMAAEAAAARAAADARPADLEARWKAAVTAEAAETPEAGDQWRVALGLIEARLRAVKGDPSPELREQHVQALVGADVGVRAVPAAQTLLALRPQSWRAHLLAGDAYFRRADFNWRVLVRKSAGTPNPSGPEVEQMNADLAASHQAYNRAVKLAPYEPAPRAARIGLRLAEPIMVSFLPKIVKAPERADMGMIRVDLLELVSASPDKVGPVWHTAHFFAALSEEQTPLSSSERTRLEQAVSTAVPAAGEQVFLEEARGLVAVLKKDWAAARQAFAAALQCSPKRAFAAEWLALAEISSGEPKATLLPQVRKRLEVSPRTQDWALLGVLLADADRAAAVEALRKAIHLDVENANARYNLGLLLLQQNPESLEARHHVERALEIRPHDAETRLAYAVTLLLAGQPGAARPTLESLLKQPGSDEDFESRVRACIAQLPKQPEPCR